MTDSEAERVTVNKKALDTFIAYADSEREAADSQFACSRAEYERSEERFRTFVDALSITPCSPTNPPS